MKYRVITAAYDVTKSPPEPVRYMDGPDRLSPYMGEEIIDTEENVLFKGCESVWDVEDMILAFWNRLNESDNEAPHYTHNGREKVVVIDVRPA